MAKILRFKKPTPIIEPVVYELPDVGDRTARIKQSLERINTLMTELKQLSK